MGGSGRREKHRKSDRISLHSYDEESAARTRPFSLEEIMLRRKNRELFDNVEDKAKEAWRISPRGSSEDIADHYESGRVYKIDKRLSSTVEKHASEDKLSSRKKVESTSMEADNLTEGRDRENHHPKLRSAIGLDNIGRMTKGSKTDKEMHSRRKNDGQVSDKYEHEAETKDSRASTNEDRHAEIHRENSERKIKKRDQIGDDENLHELNFERKHGRDRRDGKRKSWPSDDSGKVPEKKHQIDPATKDRLEERRGKYEGEVKRKRQDRYDEKSNEKNAVRNQDLGKHDRGTYERKQRQEIAKPHHRESRLKRRSSRSREREDRRRSPSLSPRAKKRTYHDGESRELSMHSLKESSRKQKSDVDRNRVSTNGSSSQHHRHGGSTSGLGGYSPRKRKTEAAVKTPSPSKHSVEKKRAGWDLPPVGTDNSSSALVASSFQLSNHTALSNMHDVAVATSLDPVIVKPLSMTFLNESSTRKNANIDSVQLTQATRPMRRLYLENLPVSATEKAVMDCLNNLLLSAGTNHIQGAQPCISCILHKDRGQALVEFLTSEDASAALSFDGTTFLGTTLKIRRPKDYVEVTTADLGGSVDAAVTISDVVIDSPDKIFVGGISKDLSSEMLMEIAGAFGLLKAYHFEVDDANKRRAFLEYVDHSVTLKACVGLNGMKLAGEVLTVVQAMPNAPSLENDGKPPTYAIPVHAKPLLKKPTQVLKIKDVFNAEALSSLSDMEIEEVLEDIRLECARFGTIKSMNVVKHTGDRKEITKSGEPEVINDVESKGASQDSENDNKNRESSSSEMATCPKSQEASGVKFHYDTKELKEDEVDDGSNADKLAGEFLDTESCQEEKVRINTTAEDMVSKSIPSSDCQECPDHQDVSREDQSELHEKTIADDVGTDIENKMVAGNSDSMDTVCKFQGGTHELDASLGTKSVGTEKAINDGDDICNQVFVPGSVLVEYGRTEACCSAAHCLHGRVFDGKMVMVEYVALNLYRARFTK